MRLILKEYNNSPSVLTVVFTLKNKNKTKGNWFKREKSVNHSGIVLALMSDLMSLFHEDRSRYHLTSEVPRL